MNPKAHSSYKRNASPPRHVHSVGVIGAAVVRYAKRVYRSTHIHCRAGFLPFLLGSKRALNMYDIMAAFIGIIIAFALTLFIL